MCWWQEHNTNNTSISHSSRYGRRRHELSGIYFALAGSAVSMIGVPNLRPFANSNSTGTGSKVFVCPPDGEMEGFLLLTIGILGIAINALLISIVFINKHLRRWSYGLLVHQGMVDIGRACIILPLGISFIRCEAVSRCSLLETAFLLLVTVSSINMLTTVLNDSPVFPDDGDEDVSGPLLMDSPQCVFFGTFMIWFASLTINLGPTFLSGGLAAKSEIIRNEPGCPIIHGPFRHYILNFLWISINVICVLLTLFHLRKLHRDLTKANVEAVKVAGWVTTLVNVTSAHRGPNDGKPSFSGALAEDRRMRNYLAKIKEEGVQKVKMFLVVTVFYVIFWGPMFVTTLCPQPIFRNNRVREITMYAAYSHAFANPTLFLILHRGLRYATARLCCPCLFYDFWNWNGGNGNEKSDSPKATRDGITGALSENFNDTTAVEFPSVNFLVPPPPPPKNRKFPLISTRNPVFGDIYQDII